MFFKEFFYFNKSDRKVIIFLIFIFVIGLLIMRWLNKAPITSKETTKTTLAKSPSKKHKKSINKQELYQLEQAHSQLQLAPFDPNTAGVDQLLSLGLQPWQVKNILKYRAKGGIFRQPADFAKVYGLTQKHFKTLEPYIRISDDYRPASELFAHKQEDTKPQRDTIRYPYKLQEGAQVMLNTADTSMLKKVPGIGSYFARQIVTYRQRLGGFVSIHQLKEIDDFPLESLSFFALPTTEISTIQKLNLNKLTLNQLKRHPYMGFYRAKAIIDYRRLHGELHSLDDLKLLPDFSEEWIRKIQPYITF